MKKIIALLLCMVCVMTMATPVFAEETEEAKQTIVSLEVDPSMEHYTITIPATISIDPTEKSATLNVTLEDVALVWHSNIHVYATPANRDTENTGSYLVHTEDAAKRIHYSLTSTQNGMILASPREKLTVLSYHSEYDSDKESMTAGIKLNVDGEYPGEGTYTDTITFTVELT